MRLDMWNLMIVDDKDGRILELDAIFFSRCYFISCNSSARGRFSLPMYVIFGR